MWKTILCVTLCLLCVSLCYFFYYTENHREPQRATEIKIYEFKSSIILILLNLPLNNPSVFPSMY